VLFLMGCVEENPALSPTQTVSPSPVPEAAVAIVNESTVRVRWKPSPSEQSAAFRDYFLVLTQMGTQSVIRRLSITGGQPEYSIELGGLRQGVLYALDIWVRFKDNTLSPLPRTLLFAPSVQYNDLNGQPIRLYEQDAPATQPNGLNFSQAGSLALLSRSFAPQWDICFEIVDGQARLGSPRDSRFWLGDSAEYAQGQKPLWAGNARRTLVGSTIVYDVSALDEVYVSASLDTAAGRLEPQMVTIPERLPSGKGLAFFVMRIDTTWAKVVVKPGPDGRLVQGEAPNRYVELAIAYQPEKAIASALPSRQTTAPARRQIR
jgi:hypothetical protein